MEYIKGEDRGQGTFLPERLEDYIAEDNPVRVIDAYVDSIDMEAHGFEKSRPNDTGRPMYAPQDLLKLYLYGYSNQVFSTRKLEAETKRNLEVIWLMKKLSPDHKTIARFRQRNAEALKSVFRHFTKLCIDMGLYGKKLIAIDGSKFKANNSRERNYTEKKLADRIARIDAKIESYMAELEAEESEQIEEHSKEEITEAVKKLRERKQGYRELQQKMAEQELRQISVTDPDSRLMKTSNGMDVCYNIQTAVDSQNKMIAEFEVTSEANDINQLCLLTEKAAEILEKPALSVTADAGYDNAGSIADLIGKGHTVNVAGADYDICIPCPKEASEEITGHEESRCVYIAERNIFICPMGNVLYPSSYHKSNRSARYRNKRACKGCQCKCTAELSPDFL